MPRKSASGSRRLAIFQPYVPKYRMPFFDGLNSVLADHHVHLTVFAGEPDNQQAQRGDKVDGADWIRNIDIKSVRIAGKTFTYAQALRHARGFDGIILGLEGTSLDAYDLVMRGRARGTKTGFWGHIGSYVAHQHPVDVALERWLMRRADRVFAYTPHGVEVAVSAGVNRARTTAVMNSVDVDGMLAKRDSLKRDEVSEFQTTRGLACGKTLAFVGGLDESKRIDFLAEALDHWWETDREIRLIVAGKGGQIGFLEKAINRGQVIHLGFAGDNEKALIGRIATHFVMPGRIGLVAVEALALGLPILTTKWPFHAPEEQYLIEGESKITLSDQPREFASQVVDLLNGLTHPRAHSSFKHPTLNAMIDNYASGALSMLSLRD